MLDNVKACGASAQKAFSVMAVGPIPHSPRMHLFVCLRKSKYICVCVWKARLYRENVATPVSNATVSVEDSWEFHRSAIESLQLVAYVFGSSSSCDIASKLNAEKESQMDIPFSCRASPRFTGSRTVRQIPNANPFVFFSRMSSISGVARVDFTI